jgi:hypothetical protein
MVRKLNRTSTFMFCAAIVLTCAGPCFADDGPMPGPALEARQKLFDRIQQARSQGIGIAGYLQAFQALEGQVKAGDTEDKISTRVVAINKAVSDQMEKAKILKTQKPLPPQGSQISGSAPPSTLPGGSAAAASPPGGAPPGGAPGAKPGAGDIMSKIKDKLGDKINNMPDSVKEKLLSDPRIIEKIKERTGQ